MVSRTHQFSKFFNSKRALGGFQHAVRGFEHALGGFEHTLRGFEHAVRFARKGARIAARLVCFLFRAPVKFFLENVVFGICCFLDSVVFWKLFFF